MKANQPFWIKERDNPQLGIYYIPCGQMSKTAARKSAGSIYGSNTMLQFETEAEYNAKLKSLRDSGKRISP